MGREKDTRVNARSFQFFFVLSGTKEREKKEGGKKNEVKEGGKGGRKEERKNEKEEIDGKGERK